MIVTALALVCRWAFWSVINTHMCIPPAAHIQSLWWCSVIFLTDTDMTTMKHRNARNGPFCTDSAGACTVKTSIHWIHFPVRAVHFCWYNLSHIPFVGFCGYLYTYKHMHMHVTAWVDQCQGNLQWQKTQKRSKFCQWKSNKTTGQCWSEQTFLASKTRTTLSIIKLYHAIEQ